LNVPPDADQHTGIELSEDPLPLVRSRVYAVSYARRNP
jgi:hypothetical protein